ncbi:MAG: hypothetical protein WBD42_03480, partial [Methylovirgula sp.]
MEAVRVFFVAVCRFAFFTPPRRDFTGASLVLRDFPVFLTDIRGKLLVGSAVETEHYGNRASCRLFTAAIQPPDRSTAILRTIRGDANLGPLIATLRYSVRKRPMLPSSNEGAFRMTKAGEQQIKIPQQ